MKRILLVCTLLVMIVTSCSDRDDDLTAVHIRIKNNSTLEFDEVLVADEEHLYVSVSPDSFSDYQAFEEAYRFAYIRITAGEEVFELQPVDFVGETLLPIGLYTYALAIDEAGQVSLEFVID
jgi:hypothetical protein